MDTVLVLEIFDLTRQFHRYKLHRTMNDIKFFNIPYIRENHYDENYVIIVYEI